MPPPSPDSPKRPTERALSSISHTPREIITGLTDDEFVLLTSIAAPSFTKKDNFREETIHKRIPPRRRQNINVRDVCRCLVTKGLMAPYRREDNLRLTTLGRQICHFLREVKARESGLGRILKRG